MIWTRRLTVAICAALMLCLFVPNSFGQEAEDDKKADAPAGADAEGDADEKDAEGGGEGEEPDGGTGAVSGAGDDTRGTIADRIKWLEGEMDKRGAKATVAEQTPEVDSGNNAWMLTSSALVLMMTAPGLALFYCGLVRKKNVLGVMMQCFFLMGLMTIIWGLYGYSLCFGEGNKWIGDGTFVLMQGIQMQDGVAPMYDDSIPLLSFMVFQGMFFIITPALICGAFAERMKFSTMCVFMVLWGTLVYCPICHWVWGGGFLARGGDGALAGGALDFAGGTVVHISSGVSALICALVLGKRLGHGSDPMPPHNLTYTTIGAALLWVGWFGFNAGSALGAGSLASSAFVVTHFSAAAGAVAWAMMEWIFRGKPTILGTCSGAVAGLVGITPAAGFVQPMPAFIIGAAAGILCYLACTAVKNKFGYDDSLDAFGVHGIGGTVGAILTGVFATQHVTGDKDALGVIDGSGGWSLVGSQAAAVGATFVLAIVVTFVILKVLDLTMGLRVTQEDEVAGLDLSQHGEEGYIFL